MPPKYGLQLPAGRGRGARPPAPALVAFGDDDDGEGGAEAVGRDVARQAARIAADEKVGVRVWGEGRKARGVSSVSSSPSLPLPPQVAAMHAAVLAQDATAFEYDAVYEDLTSARGGRAGGSGRGGGGGNAAPTAPVDRAPRYVADLLDRAKERASADELAKERR